MFGQLKDIAGNSTAMVGYSSVVGVYVNVISVRGNTVGGYVNVIVSCVSVMDRNVNGIVGCVNVVDARGKSSVAR